MQKPQDENPKSHQLAEHRMNSKYIFQVHGILA